MPQVQHRREVCLGVHQLEQVSLQVESLDLQQQQGLQQVQSQLRLPEECLVACLLEELAQPQLNRHQQLRSHLCLEEIRQQILKLLLQQEDQQLALVGYLVLVSQNQIQNLQDYLVVQEHNQKLPRLANCSEVPPSSNQLSKLELQKKK